MEKQPKKRVRKKSELHDVRVELHRRNLEARERLEYVNKHIDKLWEHVAVTNERLQDLEIQVNLISRFLTILTMEKMGMKLRDLRALLRRIEKEAITDSQIRDLEDLYNMEDRKRNSPNSDKS